MGWLYPLCIDEVVRREELILEMAYVLPRFCVRICEGSAFCSVRLFGKMERRSPSAKGEKDICTGIMQAAQRLRTALELLDGTLAVRVREAFTLVILASSFESPAVVLAARIRQQLALRPVTFQQRRTD